LFFTFRKCSRLYVDWVSFWWPLFKNQKGVNGVRTNTNMIRGTPDLLGFLCFYFFYSKISSNQYLASCNNFSNLRVLGNFLRSFFDGSYFMRLFF
jgi:hypothetical protein